MKKNREVIGRTKFPEKEKLFRIMKLTSFFLILSMVSVWAAETYSQTKTLTLNVKRTTIKEVLSKIEEQSEFSFMYSGKYIDVNREVTLHAENQKVESILETLFAGTNISYTIKDRFIVLSALEMGGTLIVEQQPKSISGKVTDISGLPLPGVTVLVKGTANGTITDAGGDYSLVNVTEDATLIFSFVGMKAQEIQVGGKTILNVTLKEETIGIEEVVAIGYGTMKKTDLTGAVSRADLESFENQPNVSIMQSLQGSVAGLNVSQVNQAGQDPSFSIRGRTSISGQQRPLIVLDGVIFRGSLIDINPDDIEGIDILKDNSAAAVYGSQASNGVMLITSKSGKGKGRKPLISYSATATFKSPAFELRPGTAEDFIKKNIETDFYFSRTAESGYLEPAPDYNPTYRFKTNAQIDNYNAGLSTDWYDELTNDISFMQSHNISFTCQNEHMDYFISVGYTSDQGHMVNENYKRYNARINVENHLASWLTMGIQTFATKSDYSGLIPGLANRYRMPYDAAYDADGKIVNNPGDMEINPLLVIDAENSDLRNNFFGNIYANVDIPFIKGLSYRFNFSGNYEANRDYTFRFWEQGFTGKGSKSYSDQHDISSDNIITYKQRFNDIHNLNITLVYGFEKRKYDGTLAESSEFINPVLGYNRLQAGNSELQSVESGAWEESSLYSMGRLFYSLRDRYNITGTIRRDGFSGFSEKNKFGLFPSVALAWNLSEESFFKKLKTVSYLKVRGSYGSTGNRTIGRYQTLAKVSGSYNYITASGTPAYGQEITSLASSDLKWETTTGFNFGVDFGLINSRLSGSMEYYNNNTTNLLYNVDIPSIGRFAKFPDNLGKIHNHGIEISVSSRNIDKKYFTWTSHFVFSRNRDELKELLGFDNDGDGKEDNLVSEGLFIGEPLSVNYDYKITGELYQLSDEIPPGAGVGSFKIIDRNNDGKIDPDDYEILNYRDPSYRFSIGNNLRYKNLSLTIFINSVQGGKNYYYGADNLLYHDYSNGFNNPFDVQHFTLNFPKGLDYWLPENPNAKYQRIDVKLDGARTTRWTQRNFVRLQDISLAYNFSTQFLNKIGVSKLKLFLSGKNLLTLTKWPGWDPETGQAINRDGRPVMKSYSLGLNLEF